MNLHDCHLVRVVLLHVGRHGKVSSCFSQSICKCIETGSKISFSCSVLSVLTGSAVLAIADSCNLEIVIQCYFKIRGSTINTVQEKFIAIFTRALSKPKALYIIVHSS